MVFASRGCACSPAASQAEAARQRERAQVPRRQARVRARLERLLVAHATSEDRAEALERRSIAAEAALEQLSSLRCAPPALAPRPSPDQTKAKARARACPARLRPLPRWDHQHTLIQLEGLKAVHADNEEAPQLAGSGAWPHDPIQWPPSDLPRACLRAQGAPTPLSSRSAARDLAEEEAQGSPCRPPRDDLETISRRSRDCAASHRDTAALGLQARSEMLLLRRALLGHTASAPTAPSSRRGSQALRG